MTVEVNLIQMVTYNYLREKNLQVLSIKTTATYFLNCFVRWFLFPHTISSFTRCRHVSCCTPLRSQHIPTHLACKGFFPQYTVTRQIFLFSQRYQFGNQRCNFVHKLNEIPPQIDLQPHNHRFTINSGFNLMYCDLPANSITTHSGVANDAMAKTSAAKHKNPPTITNLSMI